MTKKTSDMRNRGWRKLRIVVEVSVPKTIRATEQDLMYLIETQIAKTVKLRRPIHDNAHEAVVRLKSFTTFWPHFLRKEKGLSLKDVRRDKQKEHKRNDPFNGL